MFKFTGELSASKSWMNRALILQSWNPSIVIQGQSSADDVISLLRSLQALKNTETLFDAGHGGTTFRFLAIRLSRETGRFFIKASPALLKRPQQDLVGFLESVGVKAYLKADGLEIQSEGWKNSGLSVPVNTENSSQFISAVLLSCLDLKHKTVFQLSKNIISESYLHMTLALMRQVGVNLAVNSSVNSSVNQSTIVVPAGLKAQTVTLKAEPDISSAFSLICSAVVDGLIKIPNWNSQSTQPDIVFLKIFEQMKIQFQVVGSQFSIAKQSEFIGTEFDLGHSPDLFPVLCALASFAKSPSKFYGAPQLKYKESDRLAKTSELLKLCGVKHQLLDDGMTIDPSGLQKPTQEFAFDPADDHRLAMAAALFKLHSFPIKILNPQVVQKSYPEFFQHIGLL